ncbi:hypothetical protein SKAU_G00198090 [Synaphobranchus kaupii]|uniref:Uncharacterized protein n=1 Tax=Synaphobranchus kaupii TaxID=118154 RepID=A0A9Q1FEY4_SYNKA|nr:hypothetical protein SKAU_G00198090 [Synaphobranchus kaupii]
MELLDTRLVNLLGHKRRHPPPPISLVNAPNSKSIKLLSYHKPSGPRGQPSQIVCHCSAWNADKLSTAYRRIPSKNDSHSLLQSTGMPQSLKNTGVCLRQQ